jgi:hypothetical protein
VVELGSSLSGLPGQLRARIVEVLELVSDPAAQRRYRRGAGKANVGAELINLWGDWYLPKGKSFRAAFSADELAALGRFDRVLSDVSARTPDPLPPFDTLARTPAWQSLAQAAGDALDILRARG